MGRMRILMDKCEMEWDKYDNLPPGLREHHVAIYEKAWR